MKMNITSNKKVTISIVFLTILVIVASIYKAPEYFSLSTNPSQVDTTWKITTDGLGTYVCNYNGQNLYTSANCSLLFQETFNAMAATTNGGTLDIGGGVFPINRTVTIPFGINYYIDGDGIPEVSYGTHDTVTPSGGTQIRGGTWFNSQTGTQAIFYRSRTRDSSVSQISFSNLAIMPAYVPTKGSVYGIYDMFSAQVFMDNVLFMPWGWCELGSPLVSWQYNLVSFEFGGRGLGTTVKIGLLYNIAMRYCGIIDSFDGCVIDKLVELYCYRGMLIGSIIGANIREIVAEGCYDALELSNVWVYPNSGQGYLNTIHYLFNEQKRLAGAGYLIKLNNPQTNVQVDYVINWDLQFDYNVMNITSNDDRLVGTCQAFNMAHDAMWVEFPRTKSLVKPFGVSLTNLPTIGLNGTASDPKPLTNYVVYNTPIYVTSSSGVNVSITTYDASGNVMDSGLTSIVHYHLSEGQMIGFGNFTSTPKVSVVRGD